MPSGVYTRTKSVWNKGFNKYSHPVIGAYAAKLLGRTKETDPGLASMVAKRTGRTKETDLGVASASAKMTVPDEEVSGNPFLIHRRLHRDHGKADHCSNPACPGTCAVFEWSNKRHDYRFPLIMEDWQQMCRSCHHAFDKTYNSVCRFIQYRKQKSSERRKMFL